MSFERKHLNMDLGWRFLLDKGESDGEVKKSHSDVYNARKAGRTTSPANPNLFDDSMWEKIDLPHDYMREADFSPDAMGSHGYRVYSNGWYRKTFSVDPSWKGKHAMLVFDGIATTSLIFLNGSLIERSFSGYSEIAIDVSDRLYYDRINTLAVYTRGDEIEGWWYEGAGIYRHSHLYIKDTYHIAHNGIWAKPVLCENTENDWVVELETTLENTDYEEANGHIRAFIFDGDTLISEAAGEETVCVSDGKTVANVKMSVNNPERWDIDSPKLYTLKVQLLRENDIIDEDSVRIGFRTIRMDANKGFFLNEKPVKILGTCNHQDHAGVGVAIPDSIQYYRIRRLKEMGCNAYRSAHNPPTKEVLDACDEYGMIFMDENRIFESSSEIIHQMETLVRRDRNHPCLVFYSLFNEEPLQNTPEGLAIYKKLKSRAKKLDDTRFFTGGLNDAAHTIGAGMAMDVLGFNYAIQRIPLMHKQFPDTPIIGTENCSATTTRGCYVSDRENAQILNNYDEEIVSWGHTVRTNWKFVFENDFMSGAFDWTGFDYRGEPSPFVWPSVSSQFGIMDTCGFAKDSYYFHQAIFKKEPMMHLMPHWNWKDGETVRVMTVTNCDEAELFLNSVSLGRQKSDPFVQCEWQVEFQAGKISAIGYLNGRAVAWDEHQTAGKGVGIKLEADRIDINNAGQDTVPVRVSVVDEYGIEVPTASNMINFEIIGDGIIAGVGNGDPNSHEPDHMPYRKLYCGLAQVLVTAKLGAKKLKLIAKSEGLADAEISFDVVDVPSPNYVFFQESRTITEVLVSPENMEERPDPFKVYSENDMNTFASTSLLGRGAWPIPAGFNKGWREFRIPLKLPKRIPEGKIPAIQTSLVVCQSVDFYIGKKHVFSATPDYNDTLLIPLGEADENEFELRCIMNAKLRSQNGFRGSWFLTYIDDPKA
ncbi:MAG: DUF4982 domain-containing protein [Clostridia bacterium]|nr:DUF4982 domain-containing protein [Clostridia bacterium]